MILLKIAYLVFKQVTYSLLSSENGFTFILVRTIYFSMRWWWCLLCTIPTCLPVVGCHVPPHWYIILTERTSLHTDTLFWLRERPSTLIHYFDWVNVPPHWYIILTAKLSFLLPLTSVLLDKDNKIIILLYFKHSLFRVAVGRQHFLSPRSLPFSVAIQKSGQLYICKLVLIM